MLDAVSKRCGVREFRVRIDSGNYASQALFEKLGAVPNGVSEFLIHDEETLRECEEDNLEYLDEQLEAVAEKFGVEPRTLLSHVLEYKLSFPSMPIFGAVFIVIGCILCRFIVP